LMDLKIFIHCLSIFWFESFYKANLSNPTLSGR